MVDHGRDLLPPADAPEGVQPSQLPVESLVVALGDDGAERNRVDADAAWRVVDGERPGESLDRRLGGGVGRGAATYSAASRTSRAIGAAVAPPAPAPTSMTPTATFGA